MATDAPNSLFDVITYGAKATNAQARSGFRKGTLGHIVFGPV
ncbi:MAG: hypothetical protein WAM91_05620 [Candidatus Acidiferrales bacterium]